MTSTDAHETRPYVPLTDVELAAVHSWAIDQHGPRVPVWNGTASCVDPVAILDQARLAASRTGVRQVVAMPGRVEVCVP